MPKQHTYHRPSFYLRPDGTYPPLCGGAPEAEEEEKPVEQEAPKTVPVSEVQKERRLRKELEKKFADLEAWKAEQEAAGQSELEKAVKRAAELEQQLTDTQRKSEQATKRSLLAAAAAQANFHNPNAAASLIDPETFQGVDDEASAKAVVEALAQSDKYLVRPAVAEAQGAQKILANGEVINPKDGEKDPLTLEKVKAMSESEINERWDEVQPVLAAQGQN